MELRIVKYKNTNQWLWFNFN